MRDRQGKGRARGLFKPSAVLTDVIVAAMLTDYKNGVSKPIIIRNYNVSRSTVNGIVFRKTWKHVKI